MGETERLNIKDLRKLKITKVKPWSVLFTYDDIKYMLRCEDSQTTLYRREHIDDKNGHYKLIALSRYYKNINIRYLCETITKKSNENKNIVYGQIKYDKFVARMTELGLIDSYYSKEIQVIKSTINEYKDEINRLNQLINSLKDKTHSIGLDYGLSKLLAPSFESRYKSEKHFENGDYYEIYDDVFGGTHKKYGGILTDLRTLDNNTCFTCKNGLWDGIIYINSHGKKCVGVLDSGHNSSKEIELTDKNCELYIELWEQDNE